MVEPDISVASDGFRTEIERRPLLVAAIGLILGLTIAQHSLNLVFLLPAAFLLRSLRSRATFAALFTVGAFLSPVQPPLLTENTYVDSRWTVTTLPFRTMDGEQGCTICQGPVQMEMYYRGSRLLYPGEVLEIRGVAKPPSENAQAYFESMQLQGAVTVGESGIQILDAGPWHQRLAAEWRAHFLDFTARHLPERARALTDQICFRFDPGSLPNTADHVEATGTMHLLHASGLQTLVLAVMLMNLLALLPIPRTFQLAILGSALAFYALANGLAPSVARVAVMTLLAYSAYLVKREPDWLSALAASTLVFLLWKPGQIESSGFQLSAIAVFFTAVFVDHPKWKPGLEQAAFRSVRRYLLVSLVAIASIDPLLACLYHEVSLTALPAGILILTAVVPLFFVAMCSFAVAHFSPILGAFFVQGTIPFAWLIGCVLNAFGTPSALLQVPAFSAYWLVPYYALLLAFWRPRIRQP